MNSLTIGLLISGMLLFLSACAPYHHTYYPAGSVYSGYGVTQRSYYGSYPYRYDNRSYPYNSNYHYDYDDNHYHPDRHDGYNPHPSWNNGYVRPNLPNDYRQNHPDRKHPQFSHRGSVPAYPDHKDHHDRHGNNTWNTPPSDRPGEHNNPHHDRPNSDGQNYGQNHKGEDWRNQINKQRHYSHENDKRTHHENHEQARDQRESRRRDHYQ